MAATKEKKEAAYRAMEYILKACKSEITNEEYNGIIDKVLSDYACYDEMLKSGQNPIFD